MADYRTVRPKSEVRGWVVSQQVHARATLYLLFI
jgi:hypothetical protein